MMNTMLEKDNSAAKRDRPWYLDENGELPQMKNSKRFMETLDAKYDAALKFAAKEKK